MWISSLRMALTNNNLFALSALDKHMDQVPHGPLNKALEPRAHNNCLCWIEAQPEELPSSWKIDKPLGNKNCTELKDLFNQNEMHTLLTWLRS